ncbi:MAG TPA: right-handed parallel beta-helix repeat-containing protein [Draconibacterium sp.]|nr:right-handed parallel beta-helix repeat-containing protein [Draconibacterium sp.]
MKTLILLMMCLSFLGVNAKNWRLSNNPAVKADFSTFESAHEAAAAGDTIYVDGTGENLSYGNATLTKKLILIGPGYFLNENDSTQANKIYARLYSMVIESSAAGTEVYGLYFYASGTTHLTVKASNVVISRNFFFQNGYNNIYLNGNIQNVTITQNYAYQIHNNSGTASNILVANNFIGDRIDMQNTSNGIFINNVVRYHIHAYNSIIKNNIIYGEGSSVVLSEGYSGNTIRNNLFVGNLGFTGNSTNKANVNMSEVFVDFDGNQGYSTDGKWQLKAGGPASGAGENGIDCGMFGGSLPYVLSGIPPVPHIYEAVISTSGSSVSGLPVIIKVKSQN